MTDRTDLTSMKMPLNEFTNLTRPQSHYLAHLTETIKLNEVTVMGDFASHLLCQMRSRDTTQIRALLCCWCVPLFK